MNLESSLKKLNVKPFWLFFIRSFNPAPTLNTTRTFRSRDLERWDFENAVGGVSFDNLGNVEGNEPRANSRIGPQWLCSMQHRVGWGEMGIADKMGHVGYSNVWPILPAMPISLHPTLYTLRIYRWKHNGETMVSPFELNTVYVNTRRPEKIK